MRNRLIKLKNIREDILYFVDKYSVKKRNIILFGEWCLKDILAHLNAWMVHDIDCLTDLLKGSEPYWEPNVDKFNKKGIEKRKDETWDNILNEFESLSDKLIRIYDSIPDNLWNRPIWEGRFETVSKFLDEDIKHWRDEHLTSIIHNSLNDKDWITPNAEIRNSKIGGNGLFAVKPINKDDLVVVWGGTYVENDEAEKAKQEGKLVMQWDDNLFSVENRGEGEGYFINHSCDPKLWMLGTYTLTAIRDIKVNEELTTDYVLWEADENYIVKWNCNCGSKDCRKNITGKDWKLKELQIKYKDHFSPLLNKRISNYHEFH